MKIRKELATIKQDLLKQITKEIDDHECSDFYQEGMSCMICCLSSFRKPLALLQYLRAKGFFTKLLSAEARLYDFLGDTEFKRKIKEEVRIVHNTPKKKCITCDKIVTIWMPYSTAALYVNSVNGRKLRVSCASCGTPNFFSSDELKIKKKLNLHHKPNLLYALSLVNRFGYYDDDDEMSPPPEDEENYEDDEE